MQHGTHVVVFWLCVIRFNCGLDCSSQLEPTACLVVVVFLLLVFVFSLCFSFFFVYLVIVLRDLPFTLKTAGYRREGDLWVGGEGIVQD
jgi:hypothetical protein